MPQIRHKHQQFPRGQRLTFDDNNVSKIKSLKMKNFQGHHRKSNKPMVEWVCCIWWYAMLPQVPFLWFLLFFRFQRMIFQGFVLLFLCIIQHCFVWKNWYELTWTVGNAIRTQWFWVFRHWRFKVTSSIFSACEADAPLFRCCPKDFAMISGPFWSYEVIKSGSCPTTTRKHGGYKSVHA